MVAADAMCCIPVTALGSRSAGGGLASNRSSGVQGLADPRGREAEATWRQENGHRGRPQGLWACLAAREGSELFVRHGQTSARHGQVGLTQHCAPVGDADVRMRRWRALQLGLGGAWLSKDGGLRVSSRLCRDGCTGPASASQTHWGRQIRVSPVQYVPPSPAIPPAV